MHGRCRTVPLVSVCVVGLLVTVGCLGLGAAPQTVNDTVSGTSSTEDPGSTNPSSTSEGPRSDANDDMSTGANGTSSEDAGTTVPTNATDDAVATDDGDTASEPERPPNAPESIDEGAAARNVRRAVDDYRQQLGFRGLQRSRGLGVGGAATTNERLVADGPEPPFTLRGTAMNTSTDEILTMLREQGASSCTGRSKDRAGMLSAARDITSLHTGPGFPEPIPELLAEETVSSWRSDSSTKGVLEGGYRLGGADVLYESSTGVVYVTVALC